MTAGEYKTSPAQILRWGFGAAFFLLAVLLCARAPWAASLEEFGHELILLVLPFILIGAIVSALLSHRTLITIDDQQLSWSQPFLRHRYTLEWSAIAHAVHLRRPPGWRFTTRLGNQQHLDLTFFSRPQRAAIAALVETRLAARQIRVEVPLLHRPLRDLLPRSPEPLSPADPAL